MIRFSASFAVVLLVCLSSAARAQTTFFQVPSGDVPWRGQLRGQLQTGVGKVTDLSGTAVVGLGADFELGATFSSLGLEHRDHQVVLANNASDEQEAYAPLLLASGQKLFRLAQPLGIALGGQAGGNLAHAEQIALAARGYALLVLDFDKRGRCTVGPYGASQTLLGNRQNFGGFAGCEIELVIDEFAVEIDWDAGAHSLGALSMGPRAHLGEHVALTMGLQIPNGWGTADYRGLLQLELTYPGHQD